MDVKKWTDIFGQRDVRPQLMHSKLNSKNAVGGMPEPNKLRRSTGKGYFLLRVPSSRF